MDKRTKQGLVAVALLVLVGTVATVASGQEYARLGAPVEPQAVSLTPYIDNYGYLRLYRMWDDGYVEWTRRVNGDTYWPWQPLHE